MKKTHLIAAIGTLALVANLLLPSLVFAQQTGQVNINCPSAPATDITMPTTPASFSFNAVTLDYSGTAAKSSIQSNITAAADYPATTKLEVRGRTVAGCLSSESNWNVTVVASDLDNSAGGGSGVIPATSVGVITGDNITGESCDDVSTGVCFTDYSDPSAVQQDYTGGNAPADGAASETASDYSTKVNAAVEILGWDDATPAALDGLNGTASAGVAFAIEDGIEWNEESGTYTGTITYTLSET